MQVRLDNLRQQGQWEGAKSVCGVEWVDGWVVGVPATGNTLRSCQLLYLAVLPTIDTTQVPEVGVQASPDWQACVQQLRAY